MGKIQVYHFYNGSGGGVWSVIQNLVCYADAEKFDNHIIHVVNQDKQPGYETAKLEKAASQQLYYYSPKNNFYHTCKDLAGYIPDQTAIVVAHDWIELGMMSNLGLQHKTVLLLHGDYSYYYELAVKHEKAIDLFLPVANSIANKLQVVLAHRSDDIHYFRFPVPGVITQLNNRADNIIFIGRLEEAKGYHLLPLIARRLQTRAVQWYIAGGADQATEMVTWEDDIAVKFCGKLPNEVLLEMLREMKIILLPSIAEGMPVAIIEAMKAGVIPIVNDIEGGIQELVVDGESGFKINDNDIDRYARKIDELLNDPESAIAMQQQCVQRANELFDPVINTRNFEQHLKKVHAMPSRNKEPEQVYGSRLDKPHIPNFITRGLRRLM